MFGFLKDKLKGALGKLTKEVEKESVVEKKETIVETRQEKKEDKKIFEKSNEKIIVSEREIPKVEEKKKGFFQKIFGKKDEEEIIEDKEELRKTAEKVIVEPKESKIKVEEKKEKQTPTSIPIQKKESKSIEEKPILKVESKTSVKDNKVEIKRTEPVVKPIARDIKQTTTTVDKISVPETKKIIEKDTTVQDSKIELAQVTVQKHVEPIKIDKTDTKIIEKPRYQFLEEERSKKTVEKDKTTEEHKGFFTKITETFTKIQITEEKFEELFWELEVVLLENNVAVEVIDKIKRDLKKELLAGKVSRKSVEDLILTTLKQSITELFDVEKINLISNIKNKRKAGKPYIISVIGVNGSGKTTSIAKLTHKFQKEGFSVVLAASDTFRAAAIQQLEEHANRLNVKIIKHDYNSDPAAVAFDAIKYAEAKNIDIVLIDTAGRLHSNTNLMRELEKVIRVCKPDIKIFVGESITGNDCVEQAKEFDKAVGIDAIILAKADVDDKGGAAISVSYILQRPILYLGVGQTYDDLKEFDSNIIIENLGL